MSEKNGRSCCKSTYGSKHEPDCPHDLSRTPEPAGEVKELLPCPFCGGNGYKSFTCGAVVPNCPRCSDIFGCGKCDVWFDTAAEWNTRSAHNAVLECPECGQGFYCENCGLTLPRKERQAEKHTIRVNSQTVEVEQNPLLPADIVAATMKQGVVLPSPYQFIEELPNGTSRVIGRNAEITVRDHMKFVILPSNDDA